MALPIDKTVSFTVKFVDSKGNPATIVGVPALSLDNPTLASFVSSADGLSGTVTPLGPLGTLRVTAVGVTASGRSVTATGILEIVGGEAVDGTDGINGSRIEFGEPV